MNAYNPHFHYNCRCRSAPWPYYASEIRTVYFLRYWRKTFHSLTTVLAMLFGICAVLQLQASSPASDWPTFLGPNGDGIVKDHNLSANWAQNPPKVIWRKNLGVGNSSIAIANGRAVTLGNTNDIETVWCLDASNGDVIWKFEYEELQKTECGSIGPSSTPTIDGNRVYAISGTGKFFCLNLLDGSVIWEKHYIDDFEGRKPICGWAASPFIAGELLIVDPGAIDGAIVALDKRTGKTLWKAGHAKAGCANPLLYSHEGKQVLAFFHGNKLIGYDLDRQGAILYEFSWRTFNAFNASKPQYFDDKIFISSGYGEGYAVLDLSEKEPKLLHRDRELPLQFQNSLLIGGDILGIFGDNKHDSQFIRMDMATGNVRWKLPYPGKRGNLLAVGKQVIAITETGKMIIGNSSQDGFEELGQIETVPELVWTPPAFSNGRIYIRNKEGETVCISLPHKHSQ